MLIEDGNMTLAKLNRIAGHEERILGEIKKLRRATESLVRVRQDGAVSIDVHDQYVAYRSDVRDPIMTALREAFVPYRSDIIRIVEMRMQARIRELEIQLRMIRDAVSRWFETAAPEANEAK